MFRYDAHDLRAWHPLVFNTQATQGSRLDELMDALGRHRRHLRTHPQRLREGRRNRMRIALAELVCTALPRRYALGGDREAHFARVLDGAMERRYEPYEAAEGLLPERP